MSRNHYKKRNSVDSYDYYDACYNSEDCNRCSPYDQCRACIVCPPCDYLENYDSYSSERSCPDFSELCEDKPKIRCEKKQLCEKKRNEDCYESDYSDEFDDSEKSEKDCRDKTYCRGCEDRCADCYQCQSCGCRECTDYSRSALGGSDDCICKGFDDLACDKKKKCKKDCKDKKDDRKDKKRRDDKKHRKHDKKDWKDKKEHSDNGCSSKHESAKIESHKKESYASGSSSSKGKKFIISFGPKEGHPLAEYNKSSESVYINGKNGPVIHLYRGCTYFFCVEQDISEGEDARHSFVLTNSPIGGSNSRIIPGAFAPVSKGCVCFKVDKFTPRYFFYQCARNEFEGGLAIVHDL